MILQYCIHVYGLKSYGTIALLIPQSSMKYPNVVILKAIIIIQSCCVWRKPYCKTLLLKCSWNWIAFVVHPSLRCIGCLWSCMTWQKCFVKFLKVTKINLNKYSALVYYFSGTGFLLFFSIRNMASYIGTSKTKFLRLQKPEGGLWWPLAGLWQKMVYWLGKVMLG